MAAWIRGLFTHLACEAVRTLGVAMMLFPLYALFIWYLCFKHRRRWQGFVAWAAGVLGVVTFAVLDARIRTWLGFQPGALISLQLLLWMEAGAVALVGGFIVILPRRYAQVPCRKCGYELRGLEEENPRCPECGLEEAAFKVKRPVSASVPAKQTAAPAAGSLQAVPMSPDA
jgi:hypothetical protein